MNETQSRAGVYVCRCGGNISDVIDVERVADVCRHIPGVTVSKVHTFMCSHPGQMMIAEDIKKEGLDRVVVASCSPFLHELTFRAALDRGGLNPYLYEHVNIREQGSWAHRSDPDGVTALAIRMIAAALGKLETAKPLEKIRLRNHRKALVIGGGVAGMKAALEVAGMGLPVTLVEKSSRLGGSLDGLHALFPTETDARSLIDTLRKRLEGHKGVEVLLNAEVKEFSGFLGNFHVTVESGAGEDTVETSLDAGAVVMATGFSPYEPRQGELGFNAHPGVLTLADFISFLVEQVPGGGRFPTWNGRPVRTIAFIHCVGSNQVEGVHESQADGEVNAYCSRTCCTAILQQALKVKQRFPEVNVYDLHQDIRTYGPGHEQYYIDAAKAEVMFLRYHREEPPKVEVRDGAGRNESPLNVTVRDWLTFGEEVAVGADMVVLGTGMMPGRIPELIDMMKLPVGVDRFLQEVHPKLRPVELAVDGVLLAGTAQGPMTVQESLLSAKAAAAKVSAMLAHETVEIDPFVAQVDEALCCGTGLCLAECGYEGALTLVEREMDGVKVMRASVNPGLCKGCGACVAVCPNRAIDIKGNTLVQFEAMVDKITEDPVPVGSGANG